MIFSEKKVNEIGVLQELLSLFFFTESAKSSLFTPLTSNKTLPVFSSGSCKEVHLGPRKFFHGA